MFLRVLPTEAVLVQLAEVVNFARREFPPGAELTEFFEEMHASLRRGVAVNLTAVPSKGASDE